MATQTYEPIASITLGAATTSATFSAIPQTYTDLVVVINASMVSNASTNNYYVTYNSDAGTNYSTTYAGGTGSSTSSGRASSQTRLDIAYQPSTAIGQIIFQMQNYSNTTTFKSSISRSSNATSNITFMYAGLWRSTAAITSISITTGVANNIVSGSTFNLYGIKAA